MRAAEGGSLDVVKFLIDRGAEVNAKGDAAVRKRSSVSQSLTLGGFSFSSERSETVSTGKRRTALKIAQEKGHNEIAEYLKAHGAKE
jgi:hypothetical protein